MHLTALWRPKSLKEKNDVETGRKAFTKKYSFNEGISWRNESYREKIPQERILRIFLSLE